MRRILQVFYSFFSALILSVAIPNEFLHFGSPILGLIALIPLYMALSAASSFLWAGFLTSIHFATVQLLSSFWLANFRDFAVFTLGGPTAVYTLEGFVFGAFIHITACSPCCVKNMQVLQESTFRGAKKVTARIVLFACIWTVWEWTKSIGFLAYPWGTLVMTAYNAPLFTQIVDVTGTWGISFLFSLFAACVGEGLCLLSKPRAFTGAFSGTAAAVQSASAASRSNRAAPSSAVASGKAARFADPSSIGIDSAIKAAYVRTAVCTLLLTLIVFSYGVFQYTRTRIPVTHADIALIQQNGDSWDNGGETEGILTSERLTEELIKNGMTPDIVCFSESTLDYAFPSAVYYYTEAPAENPLIPFIKRINTPFLIGAPILVKRDPNGFMNGAVVFDKRGNVQGYYGKMQLVPFAEHVPFTQYAWFCTLMDTLVGFSEGWIPGTDYTVFEIPLKTARTLRFATPICFEDAFPAVCRNLHNNGADILLNITNDSWSKTASAEYQHFVIASFRAIELRTTLVRSTNSGYSAVVDPRGRVLADMPLFTACSCCVHTPIYPHTQTVYARFGDWFMHLVCTACLLYAALFVRRASKARAL